MIERNFIAQKTKEFYLKKYLKSTLRNAGVSQIKLKKIPLGEKIIISSSRPSLIVGSRGANIKDLTKVLKKEFQLENPQIEINEVKDIFLDAQLVAERIASSLERHGSARFKSIGHKVMENVMNSGALGVEVIVSGKIPSARAKSWRFYLGYLKKCGELAITGVRHAQATALLKSGMIGIKVSIMPPDLKLPDNIQVLQEPVTIIEPLRAEQEEKGKKVKKKTAARPRKRVAKKKEEKPEEKTGEAPVKVTGEQPEVPATTERETAGVSPTESSLAQVSSVFSSSSS
ncbi:MAG: 30S ribosomal protein S3 [Nanoarchaeota archaeon]